LFELSLEVLLVIQKAEFPKNSFKIII